VCPETTYEELLHLVAEDAVKNGVLLPRDFCIVPRGHDADSDVPRPSDAIGDATAFAIVPLPGSDDGELALE